MANNLQVENISIQDRGPQNTAADWVRLLRFSNDVNKSTLGVDTDRVTPLLLVAASKKLLGISRGALKGDAKDSMRYQKVFGPVEYFALHIQRDGGSVARQMLWKATNKGNLDFISTNSLQPHISSVFNLSNLTRFIDNSTPLDGIDNSMLLTRLGLGGISSEDSAPILMRLVQPSYYGYVGPARSQEKCYSADTLIMTKQGWKNIAEITLLDLLATLIDGRPAWNKPELIQSYEHDGPMYGFQNWYTDFLVTPGHRMYVSEAQGKLEFSIKNILDIYGKDYKVLCACNKLSKVDLTQKWFYLPTALSTSKGGKKLLKNILKVDIVDFAAFLGWYIALGCCECRANHPANKGMKYLVKISQDPKKSTANYNEIKALVLRLPFGATVKSVELKVGRDIVVRRKQLYDYCKQFGKAEDKFIPDWIFTAPTKARWAFVDAILKGDGAHQRDLCTISKRLALDFARLLFLLGQSVNITKALQKWEYKRRVVDPANNFIYTVFWHRTGILHIKLHRKSTKASGKTWYMLLYKGKVYCPTVPGGLVYIRRPYSTKGIWCGNSPGITAYMTKNVIRGTDGKLYQKMLNARTGKLLLVDAQKAASSIVTTNLILNTKDKYVYAMGGDSGVQIVPRSSVDYILPRADDAYSMAANAVPMLSGVKSMRLLMGCLHPETPVPFVDLNGFTDIVPAKRLGSYGDAYLSSCDKDGKETLVKLSKVVSRFSDFTRPFKRVVTSSGRVLITSPDHKWYIKQGLQFTKVTADKLKTGMFVPRSLFTKLPYKITTVLGVPITREICVLVGRLLKSFLQTSKIYRFSYIKNLMFDQQADIEKAFEQLNVIGCNHYVRDNIHYVSISDERLLDWIQTLIHLQLEERKVPKSILSLPIGFTSLVIDSYCKLGDNVGLDMYGDAWLLDIPSVLMRDGLALMLGKLYADTLYRDSYSNGRPQRALKAVPVKPSSSIILLSIVKITDLPAPAFMVDIDCDDNVYAVGNGIITHNSKYALQAVPLQLPLAPLVRSLDLATGKDMDTLLGKLVGTQWAPKPGVVKAVRKDRIDMLYDDGTTGSVDLYLNFPANAKGWISNYPMVKAGDRVVKDQLLAKSNYSDDNGVCAMGRNLRVGYLSYHGGTYEDACVISLTAAKKMGYTTMYKTGMDLDKTIRNSKSLYNTWKPGLYSKLQMLNLDLHGVVKVGAKLSKGDPMILGIRSIEPSPGTMGKRLLTDVTLTWDHLHQGVVTDVVHTKNGIKVYAKVSAPLQVGDKISQRYGGKATIAQILPDLQMPRDAKDRPLLLLFDPLGIVSRCYDKLTKFLTKHGWKSGDLVQYDLLLYIYDPLTDTCRWGRQLLPMHKSFYRGIMYGAKNKQVDFLVTPNHTMWTDKQSTAILLYGLKCSLPTHLLRVLVDQGDWFTAPYHDYVYCPTVLTGYVVTSRNSKVLCAGNTNPSQMILVALGKIALKTGKPVIVPQFMQPGQSRLKWAKEQLKKYNIPWKLNVYDPLTGKTVKDVFTGKMYFLPLKHIADTKMSARGTDLYTALGIPGGKAETGSKRIGGLESSGLVGHNAFNFLLDAKVIRGQANSQFWRSLRTGLIPVMPGLPLVHKKFFAHLQGAGMRIRKTTKGVSIMALTNQDVNLLAGSRLLKSKDTYLQKTFREIDGGLFGKDIFGTLGDRWGYIQLDEPLPNPVMLLPLAKLLRISDKQFQAVVAGKLLVNGMKNAADIKAALQKIDLKSLKSRALALLKQATPSKRDAALKRYVAIALMLANGSSPADYMLDRIPVLPPNFRPISTQGGLTMVADSNYLYAQLLDARDDAREAKALPQLYQDQARANIYRKWKLLVGLYDPLSKKLQAKDVKGLLRWALGKTPKFSAVQRKVIGSTVDTVGRGVVVPDSHLKLNEIGLPLSIAWNIYSPFVTRRLVMGGYTPVDAMKLVKGHSQAAKLLLLQEMQQRPVVMNRAPSLHKLSLMGFWPKMTTGYAIKVPPSIVSPFGMDFDGDSVLNTVLTWADQDAFFDICQKHQKKDLTFQKSVLYYIQHQKKGMLHMIDNNTQVRLIHTVCSLADIPTVEGSEVQKSPTVTEWDVKGNIFVGTINPATGEKTVARMTKVSKHTGLKMYDCTLSTSGAYSHVVTASEDHSLITLNPSTLELEKTKPAEAKGRCVPRMMCDGVTEEPYVQRWITLDKPYPMSYELGMFFGLMIGDGWVDIQNYARIACCEESLQKYILELTQPKKTLPFSKQAHLSKYTSSENRFSDNTMDRFEVYMSEEDKKALASYIGKGAYNKRIPFMSFYGSKAHLLGILCGLLATDGHIGISSTSSKKAAIKNIAYHTTSPLLKDDIQLLCNKLGVRTRATPYMGANSKATCYEIGFCLEDIAKLKKEHPDLFVVPVDYKEEALKAICKEIGKGVKNSFDLVPFPSGLFCEFTYAQASSLHYHTVLAARAKGYMRRDHAKDIADVMEKVDWSSYREPNNIKLSARTNHTPEQARELVQKWIKIVRNTDVTWELVESVTPSTSTEGWDCTVPGPYTFTLSTGTVVQDTVNIHVPVSKAAVKDVILKMMPERNLISARKHQILYPPEKAFTQGIYVATRMGLPKAGGIQTFNSLLLAKEAYKKGLIDIDTPIDIKDKR